MANSDRDLAGADRSGSTGELTLDELDAMLEEHEDIVLVDVRGAEEHSRGHIPGARAFAPADLRGFIGSGTMLVLYSGTGARGARAAMELRAAGCARCYNLKGGMAAWRAGGLPVVSGVDTPTRRS